ncbi:(2Fe-2S)-binding protein [Fusibacter ferrireducens]|uniref:2Fe-2S iron-sulfur cluster binding domain-containing protein n=1 Tax=Fusibacter ferrireducens TaxID=2785058 RepID=A0ABR9ZQA5_9FIRM|nr:2Fe-2S iron-sulfur cluster-binding protein [Fusibacter ferrireducens]MBF4692636.1 2Fe-2S iron-sulfur cluster binding domain-containing protein [Fusibacter ferrireducens]
MKIKVTLNREIKSIEINPDDYLSEVLRDNGCKSVKRGCDKSTCGACTVLVDDKPVLSCTYLAARAEGKSITTLEGEQEEAMKLGQLIVAEGGDQCGYCTPSLALTAIAMKRELVNPTEEEIIHYITGNLCRCSGYVAQLKGIKKYMGVE